MNNLNSILIEGNLTKDPIIRSTVKGTQVCTMSLASNRYYKLDTGFEKEVSYFNVETWARLAEACYNKGKKGRGVRVVGRLKQERWTDPEGKTQSRVTIVAEHVEFRPEFKKETKTVTEEAGANSSSYAGQFSDENIDDEVMTVREKQLAEVAF
jgi:single-strand DNA-binding protein